MTRPSRRRDLLAVIFVAAFSVCLSWVQTRTSFYGTEEAWALNRSNACRRLWESLRAGLSEGALGITPDLYACFPFGLADLWTSQWLSSVAQIRLSIIWMSLLVGLSAYFLGRSIGWTPGVALLPAVSLISSQYFLSGWQSTAKPLVIAYVCLTAIIILHESFPSIPSVLVLVLMNLLLLGMASNLGSAIAAGVAVPLAWALAIAKRRPNAIGRGAIAMAVYLTVFEIPLFSSAEFLLEQMNG